MPELTFPEPAEIVALLPPAGAALVLFVLGALLARGGRVAPVAIASALAIGVAFVWTFVRIRGAPAFPAKISTERVLWSVVLASVLGIVAATPRVAPAARIVAAAVAGAAFVVWVARGTTDLAGGRLAAVAAGAAAWLVLLTVASGAPGPAFGFLTAIAAGAAGQIFVMFHSAQIAQLGAAVGISMGLIGLASLAFKKPLPASIALPFGAALGGLMLDCKLFSYESPPVVALVLLAAAPLAALVALPAGSPPRRAGIVRVLLACALGLAITGTGFWLAWRVAPPSWG